jgi:RNA recognition motif-containing protein
MKKLLLTGAIAALLSTGAFATKLYVSGLSWSVEDGNLRALFSRHGEVVDAKVIHYTENDSLIGVGFVEMPDDGQADKAIKNLHGIYFNEKRLKIYKGVK